MVEVRQKLIEVFNRWGKCGAMRVDNGEPLGCPQPGMSSILALWLIAHDIDMIFNKPRCPQQNAKVEKMQDVSSRWAEIHLATNLADLQTRLDREAIFQRTEFPVSRLENQTRLYKYPELETSRRVFDENTFDPNRAYQFLAKKSYVRLVSKKGQIFQFGKRVSVGVKYASQTVEVKFEPQNCSWKVYSKNLLVKIFEADNLQKDKISNLIPFMSKNAT